MKYNMNKKLKKNSVITKKKHDKRHKKNKEYNKKDDKEHEFCHKKMRITIKK